MIKKFISYYRPHLPLFTLDMTAAVIISLCNLFYPTIVKNIMNDYALRDTPKMLFIWAGVLLGIYVLKSVCTYIVGYYGHIVGIRIQKDMRRDLFRKYESLPFSYFDEHKTGDLLSRLVGDLFDVSELAHHGPENIFLAVLMLTGSFIMLVRINLSLTLILFSLVPLIILCAVLSRRDMSRSMSASRRQIAEVNVSVENSIAGIRETKSYVAEHLEEEKFETYNSLFAKYRRATMKCLGRFDAVMAIMQDVLYLVIILVGGLYLYYGRINSGEFAAFVLYTGMFLIPVQKFTALFQQLQEGASGFSRFCEIMAEPEEVDGGTKEIDAIRGDIEFSDVSFGYDTTDTEDRQRMVINHLNMSVRAGETVALVGPSGGGKSTLCNLIPRFYNLSGGKITIDGTDIRDITLPSLRRAIGSVSQNIFLFDGTIRENIAYGAPGATEKQIVEAAKRANIHDYIMTLDRGYDTRVGERGVKLSGGQRQRVAIARVFLKNPSLLILDEATSALDNATEMMIQSSLEELAAGRTVIVVAHRLSTVKNADRIFVIDDHGICEEGTHEELMALGGEYSRLYAYQFKER